MGITKSYRIRNQVTNNDIEVREVGKENTLLLDFKHFINFRGVFIAFKAIDYILDKTLKSYLVSLCLASIVFE